ELLARAAIGYEEAAWRPGIADIGVVDRLEEAATALGGESTGLRGKLLAGLARALDFLGERERGAGGRTSAIEMAREIGDRDALATVLMRSYWSRGETPIEEILEMLIEARDLGEELGNTEIVVESIAWQVHAFMSLCDTEAARRTVALHLEAAEKTAQPFM